MCSATRMSFPSLRNLPRRWQGWGCIEAQLDHVVGTRLRLHTTERAGSNFAAS